MLPPINPSPTNPRSATRSGRQVGATEIACASHQQLLGREPEDGLAAGGRYHHLFLDPCRGVTVGGRRIGLQREDHALLDLDRVLERVEPADDRALPQRQANAMSELKTEAFFFALEPEVLRAGPQQGDVAGSHARPDKVDSRVDP